MDNIFFSILLVLIGLFVGIIAMIIFNYIKNANTESKAEKMIANAKKEADKAKRDGIIELKEESHRIKLETDEYVKEKKLEIKESEERLLARENSIDRRDQILNERENLLSEKENGILLYRYLLFKQFKSGIPITVCTSAHCF